MTPLVRRTLEDAGLLPLYRARAEGRVPTRAELPEGVDLIALGALADAIRAEEVGPRVAIFANTEAPPGALEPASQLRGLELAREVAVLRVTSPRGARVRVDWGHASLEFSVVCLGFGASELIGPIANRKGLPIADEAAKKVKGEGLVSLQVLQKREIDRVVRCAGREPVFEGELSRVVAPPEVDLDEDAQREVAVHG